MFYVVISGLICLILNFSSQKHKYWYKGFKLRLLHNYFEVQG
jgi:hypothetical protein